MTCATAESSAATSNRMPDLIARVGRQCIAVSCKFVQEVVLMPTVTAIPAQQPHVRGVINLRGKVIPMADIRVLFGLVSLQHGHMELENLLKARADDHLKWVSELEACVKEKREFKLARDPHACAFGKWYDAFKPDNDTITFRAAWAALDEPHKKIHSVAAHVLAIAERGDYEGAQRVIDETRNGALKQVITLFDEVAQVMRQTSREVAIVLEHDDKFVAISADKVECAEHIPPSSIEPLQAQMENKLISGVARRASGHDLALILNVDAVYQAMAGVS